jgi:hypothetical protein
MIALAKTSAVALALVGGIVVTAHAQYYNAYDGTPNTQSWSAYNYPGYQSSALGTPYYYYYPGYSYSYHYPTYSYAQGSPYPTPLAYWDPYVALRPYSDNAGPKASGHGGP